MPLKLTVQKKMRRRKIETKEFFGIDGAILGQGRSGGRLARDVGSHDELKRSKERPAGKMASSSCRRSSQR
jgi:hypothetical protein